MKKNKPVLLFLLRFFVSYFILSALYQWYLKENQHIDTYTCSPVTEMVANHTVSLGNFLGYNFAHTQHTEELSFKLFTDDLYIARIVEGCNSISVIILFWAFIIAFTGNWKKTILFGLVGSILIYTLNIIRIVSFSVIISSYPQYNEFLHQILFPSVIYGFTFLLWVVWVKYFATTS